MSICKLRDAGLVDNSGKIQGFEGLTTHQASSVLRNVLHVMSTMRISDYVASRRGGMACRTKFVNFPDDIVYLMLSKYLAKCYESSAAGQDAPCLEAQ